MDEVWFKVMDVNNVGVGSHRVCDLLCAYGRVCERTIIFNGGPKIVLLK
jgi:hypothetical protein